MLTRLAGLALLLGLMLSMPAAAADDCGFLPDLNCDRDARFSGFVAPMTTPFLFEDPFITTNLSLWAIWHDFPEAGLFQGGDAVAYAAQIRVALTERLGLIATKDGHISIRPDSDLLGTESGFMDWGFGLKYALIRSDEARFMLSPSLRYETTNGSRDALNGNGEGVFIPTLSSAWGASFANLTGSVGMRLPIDGDEESQVLFYNLQIARPITDWLVGLIEFNGLTYVDDGAGTNTVKLANGTLIGVDAATSALGLEAFEGFDVANLGAGGVEGDDVLSAAIGVRMSLAEHVSLGIAYERPITKRRHILKQRALVNLLIEY